MSGIYWILCTITNEIYIGQSIDLKSRFFQHMTALKKGIHKNKKLQEAFSLYGESAFEFKILMECPVDMLNHMEDYFIKKHNTIHTGFNIQAGSVKYVATKEEISVEQESYITSKWHDEIDDIIDKIKKKYVRNAPRTNIHIKRLKDELYMVTGIYIDHQTMEDILDRLHIKVTDDHVMFYKPRSKRI